MGLTLPPLVSLTSIQVPPLQFEHFGGLPPRLVNTHALTNMTAPSLPPNVRAMMGAFAAGTAIASPLGAGVISGINTAISSVSSTINSMTSSVLSQIDGGAHVIASPMTTLTNLQGIASSMAGAGIAAIESQINTLVTHLPTIGGIMSVASAMSCHLGLPSLPSFSALFAPFSNGVLSSAVKGISTALSGITSAISGGLAAAASGLNALTTGFNNALNGVTSILNNITDGINSAVSRFMQLSNAAAMAGMKALAGMFSSSCVQSAASDFNAAMSGLTSPHLQLIVPNVTGIGTTISSLYGAVAGTIGAADAVANAIIMLPNEVSRAINSVIGTINGVISGLIQGAVGAVAAAIGAMNSLIALGADITGRIAAAILGLENGVLNAIDFAIAALQDGMNAATDLLQNQCNGAVTALQGNDFTTAQTTAVAALLTIANATSAFLTDNTYSYGIATGTSTANAMGGVAAPPGVTANGNSTMHAVGSAKARAMAAASGSASGLSSDTVIKIAVGTTAGTSTATAVTSITPPLRNWYDNPGQDGTFWVTPFQTTAIWTTSGSLVNELRDGTFGTPTGYVHLVGDYATPWVIGHASDPLVTVTDGTKTINVRIPLGTVPEAPYHSTDASIGGADATQPYLVWSITGAVINTGSVQPYGSVITGRQLCIDDGAGPIMCDAITGQPGTNNSIGAIQDSDLTLANAAWTSDPNRSYVIPHMLTYSLDPSQCNSGAAIWPSFVIDESLPTTGGLNQGYTIGIPLSTPRPVGKSPGFYLLFDSLQQYGWAFNNLSGTGCLSIDCYSTNPANATLAADVAASINAVMPYIGILSNQTGIASVKGYQPGGFNAFPAPPLLDLSPTGGLNVAPATFEAWYPSGFNVTP